jgi:3-oxoacyl-(acyl-carrier-protein) synthase
VSGPVPSTGLTVLAEARWPQRHDDPAPRPIAGFIVSSFSPLVAEVAERCLRQAYAEPPADAARGARTAVVIVSASGDAGTAGALAEAVDRGERVAPLLFFQAVPNAVAGHVAARWGLGGPVLCLAGGDGDGRAEGDVVSEALAAAALLIEDGDADEALVVVAEQDDGTGAGDCAIGLLVRGEPRECPQ